MDTDGIGDSGYTLEEIADYHERGRTPAIAAIDGDPQCRAILDSMDRLGALSRELLEREADVALEESWFQKILGEVARESRAGRDLPMDDGDDIVLVVTEGAVRGLVRDAGRVAYDDRDPRIADSAVRASSPELSDCLKTHPQ